MAATFNNNINPDTPRKRGDYNAAHMSSVTPDEDIRSVMINRIAWGPVFSGVAVGLVVQFVLNLVGVGVGVASLVPDTTGNWAVANLSLGTAIWWTVSGIIAFYCGGYAAGRLSGDPVESTAGWHGLVSWAVSIIVLSGLVMAGTGMAMGGMLNTTGFNANAYRGQAGAAAPNNTPGNAPGNVSGNASGGAVPDNTAAGAPDNAGAAATDSAAADNPPAITPAPDNTGAAANATTAGTPAAGTANSVQVPVATAGTLDAATLSKLIMEGSLLSAIALILGGIAAWFGGRAGTIKPTITTAGATAGGNVNLH
jgi:hypothetical protein